MDLLERITDFQPDTEQESISKNRLISLMKQYQNQILDRDCPAGHITCSGIILSPDLQHTLMAYHLIYQSVGWIGGHADGDPDLLGVALREAKEETSVKEVYPISGKILSLDALPVPEHEKHGKIVPAHLHYNITYGLIAPENQKIADKPDENRNVQWIPVEKIPELCTESHMIPIYQKIISRMRNIRNQKQEILPEIVAPLLAWYQEHKRDLPWRKDTDPYHVWISEIMLQQTRVEAVKQYYIRFLNALPDVRSLAECPEEKLLKLWEGLGYYNRVRNMQKTAKILMTDYQGEFPEDYDKIRALPGIGDYTAGAICSICFGMSTPAVDGNVLRVMARIREDFRNILNQKLKSELTAQLARIYTPENSNFLTQAFMELGAIVCIPNGRPACKICPLKEICMAKKNFSTSLLPVRIKKQKRKTEKKTVFILIAGNPAQNPESCRIAIRKRPESGLLAGLWELPNLENFLTPEEAVSQCSAWGSKPKEFLKILPKKHVFTHITWDMQGIYLECEPDLNSEFLWITPEQLHAAYSLPTAFRIFLENLF
ncbi:MAG: A/G-specific adenine glycosylase [Oscillospiraceae bacterium]|nr:A/G-specific adenine glycosylase [Oscillospiraceae bacterium]